jgi:hypothetical protein
VRRAAVAALALAAALAGCRATAVTGLRTTEQRTEQPAALAELSLERLRADFNRDQRRPRLLALVSPS